MFSPHRSDLPLWFLRYSPLFNLLLRTLALLTPMNMVGNNGSSRQPSSVTEALEIARDSEEGARDPAVKNILETALAAIWAKIEARPTSFVMNREEFAVFNFFQHRFEGLQLAASARKRYWDSLESTNGA